MHNSSHFPTQSFFRYFPELAAALIIVTSVLQVSPSNTRENIIFWTLFILVVARLILFLYSAQKRLAMLFITGLLVFMSVEKGLVLKHHEIKLLDCGAGWAMFNVYFKTSESRRVVVFLSSPDGQWLYPNPICVGQVTSIGENTFYLQFSNIHWNYLQQFKNAKIEMRIVSYNEQGKEQVHGVLPITAQSNPY